MIVCTCVKPGNTGAHTKRKKERRAVAKCKTKSVSYVERVWGVGVVGGGSPGPVYVPQHVGGEALNWSHAAGD